MSDRRRESEASISSPREYHAVTQTGSYDWKWIQFQAAEHDASLQKLATVSIEARYRRRNRPSIDNFSLQSIARARRIGLGF
jgi:hypothetical protein